MILECYLIIRETDICYYPIPLVGDLPTLSGGKKYFVSIFTTGN